jgi:hypothetical protein
MGHPQVRFAPIVSASGLRSFSIVGGFEVDAELLAFFVEMAAF